MTEVILYADGGCEPNPGIGGWAAILQYAKWDDEHIIREFSGCVPNSTNNSMELTAVIEGIRRLKRPVHLHIVSDSQYVINGIGHWLDGVPDQPKGWMVGWKAQGWRRRDGKLLNQELWRELYAAITRQKSVTCQWIRGHSGHVLNERCDTLAQAAIRTHTS